MRGSRTRTASMQRARSTNSPRAARASIVLIGEASHGTCDFYAMRADLTRRLIADHGFCAVTLEADWPDTFRGYRPDTERWSHYFEARLPEQFDAIIHLDNTVAVTPLDRTAGWDEGGPPETWPSSL